MYYQWKSKAGTNCESKWWTSCDEQNIQIFISYKKYETEAKFASELDFSLPCTHSLASYVSKHLDKEEVLPFIMSFPQKSPAEHTVYL